VVNNASCDMRSATSYLSPTRLIAARMEVAHLENDDDAGFGNGDDLLYQQMSKIKSISKTKYIACVGILRANLCSFFDIRHGVTAS
jgi:hypothetical protein